MSRARDAGLFLAIAVAWGGSFPAIEVGLTAFDPVAFATLRYYLAAGLALGYVGLARDRDAWLPRTRDDGTAVLAAGVLSVAGNAVFLFYGQQYTTAGVASIIYSLIPVLTAALAGVLIGGDRSGLGGTEVVGVVVGLGGVGLVANPDPSNLGGELVGEALLLCAVGSVALGSVLVARADATCDSLVVTAWGMLVGGVVLHGVAAGLGQRLTLAAPAAALGALAWLAVVSSALAYALYFDLLDRVGPFQVSLVSYVVPLVATATGAVLLGERVDPLAVGGFVLVVVGFLLVKRDAVTARVR